MFFGEKMYVCLSRSNGRLVSIRCVKAKRGFNHHGAELSLLRLHRRRISQVDVSSFANTRSERWAFSFLVDESPPLGGLVVFGEFAPRQQLRLSLSPWFDNPSLNAADRLSDVPRVPHAWAFEAFPMFVLSSN
jgi:hypothetical protein